jgi:hypothetical protein
MTVLNAQMLLLVSQLASSNWSRKGLRFTTQLGLAGASETAAVIAKRNNAPSPLNNIRKYDDEYDNDHDLDINSHNQQQQIST